MPGEKTVVGAQPGTPLVALVETSGWLGLAQGCVLADDSGDGTEVFSMVRDSAMEPKHHLDRFSHRGAEHQRSGEKEPA